MVVDCWCINSSWGETSMNPFFKQSGKCEVPPPFSSTIITANVRHSHHTACRLSTLMFSPEFDLVWRLQSKTPSSRIILQPWFGVATIWTGIKEIHDRANLIQILISFQMKCSCFSPVGARREGRGCRRSSHSCELQNYCLSPVFAF